MNKEKLITNWDNITAETKAQILALAEKEIENDYFMPKEGEKYYIYPFDCEDIIDCDDVHYIEMHAGSNSKLDKYNIETGNVFRTPEEAIFAGRCDYYTKRFEAYVNRHTDKLDWDDDFQCKCYAFYTFDDMHINIDHDYIYNCKNQGTAYASSEQILKDAINDIGKENFLKYVMRVEKTRK